MLAGLDHALEGAGQPGVAELRGFLAELLGGRQAFADCKHWLQTLEPARTTSGSKANV